MTNTVNSQPTDLFQELDDADLSQVSGGAEQIRLVAKAVLFINVIGNKLRTGELSVEELSVEELGDF